MGFYGAEQAAIHHERFGDLATDATRLVVARLAAAGLGAGHVTDLGCGSGILAAAMLDAGYAVTGACGAEEFSVADRSAVATRIPGPVLRRSAWSQRACSPR